MEVKERILLKQPPYSLDFNLPGRERTQGVAWTNITDRSTDCSDALEALNTFHTLYNMVMKQKVDP